VLGIIGDQFDECTADRDQEEGKTGIGAHDSGSEGGESSGEWPEICGATLSVRQSEDILSVWNRVDGDMKLRRRSGKNKGFPSVRVKAIFTTYSSQ